MQIWRHEHLGKIFGIPCLYYVHERLHLELDIYIAYVQYLGRLRCLPFAACNIPTGQVLLKYGTVRAYLGTYHIRLLAHLPQLTPDFLE